jgi:hypothetical protein
MNKVQKSANRNIGISSNLEDKALKSGGKDQKSDKNSKIQDFFGDFSKKKRERDEESKIEYDTLEKEDNGKDQIEGNC